MLLTIALCGYPRELAFEAVFNNVVQIPVEEQRLETQKRCESQLALVMHHGSAGVTIGAVGTVV